MAYHLSHIVRFLETSTTSKEQDREILERADAAIKDSGREQDGIFSASKLNEVLGDPEIISVFNNMWDLGQLQG